MASKIKRMPIAVQAGLLRSMFPNSNVTTFRDLTLVWKHTLKPSPLSADYSVKLEYTMGYKPNVYVIDPMPLDLARGATKLPHVYDQKKQRLCLYYPKSKQWDSSMSLARTIVLWTYEWLYHYEIWLGTDDDWKGGGLHPFSNKPKI